MVFFNTNITYNISYMLETLSTAHYGSISQFPRPWYSCEPYNVLGSYINHITMRAHGLMDQAGENAAMLASNSGKDNQTGKHMVNDSKT